MRLALRPSRSDLPNGDNNAAARGCAIAAPMGTPDRDSTTESLDTGRGIGTMPKAVWPARVDILGARV